MTSVAPPAVGRLLTRTSFDAIFRTLAQSRFSADETELLRDSHWNLGQDARLREDVRFRQTSWGRWVAAGAFVANDATAEELRKRATGS